ncbi:NADH-dependent [FeFe] hydrogenase, group A6 [Sporomusa acidovorans]|uniref:NADP-reducing hydrogenase subunit HndD n=1 Tax=Sporomusa acidovorans (strain ATCC 49682 / DSM 3132 / Mol) TaxID=1123286 RepID=A0ABZ3J0M4_SPOA4|nr:NADH-dependent [FeFe] hydrogenase, group A6 [Sporomusa acidovorans]OZC22478.1 NADP-reducing hydrogenase subunit HndC [Sporomusa acidovorans DSM 3132]SDE73933.1 NAD(P)-dependent iron-only hydrogenase catalytic subunit [Sporomusa acidovorans]
MEMVNITIDGQKVAVPKTSTVLEAATSLGIKVPTLCYHPELRVEGACRVCMVEVEGARSLVASCVYPVNEGMVVHTNTAAVREARKTVVELLLANHPTDCLSCQRNLNCELQNIAADLGVREIRFDGEKKSYPLDNSNPSLVRDQSKCILCGRCIRACSERQGVHVYSFANRGFNTTVVPAFNLGLDQVACTFCGQCAAVCPTGAIVEKDDTEAVWNALSDPAKHVIVQTAPAVRVALGEALGLPNGSIVTGKMVASLKRLGFDKVFDTNFSADLTIWEEGSELIDRLTNGGTLPMITSCSPGWVNFIELKYPDLLDHLSTAKSPQQMFGALAKTYYAEKAGIDPKDIVSVSIMPCTAKKAEAARPEMNSSGYQDVDYVLTTRELARMIREAGITFANLPEAEFDAPLGVGSGAGMIFGATGGVMEAALRTVAKMVSGKELDNIEFEAVRGMTGIKEASVQLKEGLTAKVAIAHTLANARILLDKIRAGEADYHFIEIMACPGGCSGGGGQPIITSAEKRQKRLDAIYECDRCSAIRKSHDNPAIKELYDTWLGKPLGEKSHHLLHTHYHPQNKC